jgi:hypothetical protein
MGYMQFLYFYFTLCACCYAASQRAPLVVVIPAAMALTVPNIRKQSFGQVLTMETLAHSLNAFAAVAYAAGRGIASFVAP